jgi:predicted TPR repeat methyltransferase
MRLAYKTPQLLFEVFCDVAQNEDAFKNCRTLVDLGCGTGLAGKYFQSICGSLTGVDISSEMIQKSRLTGVYDALLVSEIMAYLESETLPMDVFIATDVFNYFGEIFPLFVACRNRQMSGGLLAFSVETLSTNSSNEHSGFKLSSTRRFQHEKLYVSRCAEQADYRVLSCTESVLRREDGFDVKGYLFVLKAK